MILIFHNSEVFSVMWVSVWRRDPTSPKGYAGQVAGFRKDAPRGCTGSVRETEWQSWFKLIYG